MRQGRLWEVYASYTIVTSWGDPTHAPQASHVHPGVSSHFVLSHQPTYQGVQAPNASLEGSMPSHTPLQMSWYPTSTPQPDPWGLPSLGRSQKGNPFFSSLIFEVHGVHLPCLLIYPLKDL